MALIAINNDRLDSRLATLYLEIPAGRSIVQVFPGLKVNVG